MKSKLYYIYLGVVLILAFLLVSKPAAAQNISLERTTIMEYVINERPLLAELLTTAGMAPALSGSSSYTLLMPPEARLQELKGQSVEKIRSMMAAHLVKGALTGADFKEGSYLQTYGGEKLYVCRKRENTLLNGVKLRTTDITLRNGMVHELEGMLQP
ncbi:MULTISPECIES: fasciclin domain-containing protein [Pontibacter]|uniref:Uncaracterized surface protein containing fasciclin (FAS1) repeats n=1 Tax=Pontibacter lucknowensis TaxID=1077936 RepID=A0A1N6UPF9_9BACT|nr:MULTISPECIES: fasciclin domain-containing protein [Pontibacter]EJF09669.1 beta-Ig-H3/fasciclin [Pontibacter sp. BAB1700]SIQ67504.1 Uncaracterized surface protein containing fasciclin (FAS1) repeats [Pontibacter lucknowensis]